MRHRGRKTRRGSAAVRAPVCARRLVSYQYSSLLCRIAGVLSEAQLMHHIVAAVDQRGGNNNNNHREETGEREGGREGEPSGDPVLPQPLSPALCPPPSTALCYPRASSETHHHHHQPSFIAFSLSLCVYFYRSGLPPPSSLSLISPLDPKVKH